MKFNSTRDKNIKKNSFEVILEGLSPDGGLYVTEKIRPMGDIEKLMDMSYIELASYICGLVFDDFSKDEMDYMLKAAYLDKFPEEVVGLSDFDGFSLIELFHGKTQAFKDLGLSLLPQLMAKSIEKTGIKEDVAILVATSGDTGKAALEGFKNADRIRVLVLYPKDGVSKIQYRQMACQEGENLEVLAVDGNFDDCQSMVKSLILDENVKNKIKEGGYVFSSANSINYGRLVGQIVYYISSYIRLLKRGKIKKGEKVNIVVPTGNFGNILASYYAKLMGLPVNKFILASNDNKVLVDFLESGVYDANRELILTTSPSMDILVSSNLERLLYHILNEDTTKVRKLMESLNKDRLYKFDEKIDEFYGNFASEGEVGQTIKEIFDKYGYVVDPHTAVAICVYEKYQKQTKDKTYSLIASTASPYKFASTVLKALGEEVEANEFDNLRNLANISKTEIPKQLRELENKEIIRKQRASLDEIKDKVIDIFSRSEK